MKNSLLEKLTSKKLLTKNVIVNFIAQGIPLFIALITIPLIIKGLGVDRFSILTLIWIVIGYSNLFDFGLARAVTQLISKKIANNDTGDMPVLVWTTLLVVFILGIFAAIVICLLTPFIIDNILRIPATYRKESVDSLVLLAITLPALLLILNIRGILEAYQMFITTSLLRIPIVFVNYIGPLFVLPFTNNLTHIVLLLVVGRFIAFIFYVIACSKAIDGLFANIKFNFSYLKPLLCFGSWITVSNIVGPISFYLDRIFIAYILSALIVVYYTTPFDVISRLTFVPYAIMGVMFPAFSAEFHVNKERTREMYFKTMKYTVLILLIPVIVTLFFAKWGLTVWISENFAQHSHLIAQILAVAIFVGCINEIPTALIQGTGRSDITGKILLAVLPLYLVLLFYFIQWYGLVGVALAWFVRAIIDCILFNYYALKLLKVDKERLCEL